MKRNLKGQFHSQQPFGPHNEDIISVLVGNLLGDGHAEFRSNATRFSFHFSIRNMDYIHWLHKFYSDRGYCSSKKLTHKIQIGKKGTKLFSVKWSTWTFSSLNWLYELFYIKKTLTVAHFFAENCSLQPVPDDDGIISGPLTRTSKPLVGSRKKVVPKDLERYLTPLAFAVWIMDDGSFSQPGLLLHTENFDYEDLLFLQTVLKKKFGLDCNIHKQQKKFYRLYFPKSQMQTLTSIVKPFLLPSMYYKIGLKPLN